MSFRSPWRRRPYVLLVEAARRLLRPLGLETALLRRLVAAQNRRVRRHLRAAPPRSVLLILPRCLKRPGCRVDVRATLRPCRDCRDCQVGDLARLAGELGFKPLVAFRSHIARRMARRERPDLIVATACEDRLVKALRGVPEIPALLTPLAGLERPCRGATTDLGWLARELRAACAGRPAAAPVDRPDPDDLPGRAASRRLAEGGS